MESSDNLANGIAAAPGIVIGKAYIYKKEILNINQSSVEDVEEAIQLFHESLEKSKKELLKVFNVAKDQMGEKRSEIFEAQLMILDDPVLISTIERRIREEKKQPESVVDDEISKYQQMMFMAHESYMRERALDIEDIKNRIVKNLQKKRWESKISNDVIVVSDSITPADTILFTKFNVKGYVTVYGGLTSHAAILARSLDLPAVLGVHGATENIKNDDTIIVDGFHGLVFINPNEKQIEFYQNKIKHLEEINASLAELHDKPATTTDGKEIELFANVDVSGEVHLVITNRAKGVGLYRTEQIIEELGEFPDEEQQTKIYANLATRLYPQPLTIRVFDIGGDKVKFLDHEEANPFLGLRGIRLLLANPKLFKEQIRAILRASVNKNILLMIPMVSTIDEIIVSRQLIEECKKELQSAKIQFDKHMQVGMMMEVPSAAVMAQDYAELVDFVSIGTNDLIQYIMAVDRGNDIVNYLYQEFHPAVIRTINYIVHGSKRAGKKVSICGEMAADTLAIPLLVGLDLDSFSLSPAVLPTAKKVIRSFSYESAKTLANECLQLNSHEKILKRIEQFFAENNIKRTRNIL
ncbi:MAG: phosphoenolpyruvate--protein phosphotransferase [Ignavibacteriaceae bacterium]|nr:phosphoenolpyruvate--protein phosphotransferase [Ignavibacteriaceae bacterium]